MVEIVLPLQTKRGKQMKTAGGFAGADRFI
jgi:hypothetical protein